MYFHCDQNPSRNSNEPPDLEAENHAEGIEDEQASLELSPKISLRALASNKMSQLMRV